MIGIYNAIQIGLLTMGFPVIVPAIYLSEKHRKTAWHRMGIRSISGISARGASVNEPKPIWLHALSVGEVMAAGSLVKDLKATFPDRSIRFSVSTLTGFETAHASVGDKVDTVFYFPYDLIFSVRRVIRWIDPAVIIIIETDVWPNFLSTTQKKKIPVILANARISRRSFSRYKRFLPLIKPLFSTLSHTCVPTEADADRFKWLGVSPDRITITGNMKYDQKHTLRSTSEITGFKTRLNMDEKQKILTAGSTHKGEEVLLLEAFIKICQQTPDTRIIVAPRDPKRANTVRGLFQSKGFSATLYQQQFDSTPKKQAQVIVVDTLGVLNRLYSISDVVFVGGSLVPLGGHNPLEPAAESKPILFGPNTSDFEAITQKLIRTGAAIVVHNAKDISDTVTRLFENFEAMSKAGQRAFQVFDSESGAVGRTVGVVESYLCHTAGPTRQESRTDEGFSHPVGA